MNKDNFDPEAAHESGVRGKLKRGFVEGSPSDRVWGVGRGSDDAGIDDERNWRGDNRLGKCHDEACLLFGRRRMACGGAQAFTSAPEEEEDAQVADRVEE